MTASEVRNVGMACEGGDDRSAEVPTPLHFFVTVCLGLLLHSRD